MERASVPPIPDEINQIDPGSVDGTGLYETEAMMHAMPIINMRKTKIDPFRLEGLSDSLIEFQRTEKEQVISKF